MAWFIIYRTDGSQVLGVSMVASLVGDLPMIPRRKLMAFQSLSVRCPGTLPLMAMQYITKTA